MTLSVTTPIDRAMTRTRQVLFEPFDLPKWLGLGFCAFLAQLGSNFGGGSGANIGPWQKGNGAQQWDRATEWVRDNGELIVTVGCIVLVAFIAIGIALMWLRARGNFMFLDGVVRNRGAVVEPWNAFRSEGNSVFRFLLCVGILGFVAGLVILGAGIAIAWADIEARRFGPAALGSLVVGGGLLVFLALAMTLIDLFLIDFVVPAMYARSIDVTTAWQVVKDEVLAPYPGRIILYVLMKILISLVFSILLMAVVCGTLCIAACCLALPYVGTVLMLPLLVFGRCYSLYFLDQLGGEWRLVPSPEEPVA